MDASSIEIFKGMIVLWYGAIADIPTGWVLCDGSYGSPNLKNVFIVGAGDTYVVDAVGGSANHNHVFSGTGHSHSHSGGAGLQAGTDLTTGTTTVSALGTTDAADGLPPYRALAYIMKR